ncbi:hypothetical protein [Acinetobacter sp. CFCC 11171]|uniref:hypothetical protein n=1 Tax=Acinetobacter sp. CFCC 11171 TaxID=1775558 RepID=UPI000DCFA3BC|nr:hypothetical protein [Acinetobacter sp. CFCC 11171]
MNHLVCRDDVHELIATLRTLYASQFNKNFPADGKNSIPMQVVEERVAKAMIGVTSEQFQRGLLLLSTSGNKFMPSFADFRTMCIGEDWWNAQKAWIKACDYTKIMKHQPTELPDGTFQYREITKLAKFALDQVRHYINDGEMYRAKDEFIRLYEAYVMEAQIKGRVQEWYQEPKTLTWNNEAEEYRPATNEEAQKHLEELKKKLNVKNRAVPQPQKLKATPKQQPVETYWPDPFDNPQAYLHKCAVDGVKVPIEIRRQFEG